MKKNLLIVSLLISATLSGTAQISCEKRIEFELKDGYKNEKIIEFGKDGFLMISKSNESSGGERGRKYEHFNTNLESIDTKSIFLNEKYYSDETFYNDESIHTLFKDRKGNFSIVSVKASSMGITKVDGVIPKKSWIKEMAVLGDYAFFNASIKRSPYLFSVYWKTGKQKMIMIGIENINPKKISLKGFQVLEKSNEIFLFVKVIIDKRKSDIYVVKLNDKGKKDETYNLTDNVDQNIIDISVSKLDDGKYIFTGTYSTKYTTVSEGLFFCLAEDHKIKFIKTYNFLDLENFLTYLPEKKQKKLEKKKERKEEKGKELKISYRIAGHDVITLDDGYLYLGEAYYPTYRTESYTTTTYVNGIARTTTHYRHVFDGYQYTHVVTAKFDKEGNIQWDETFEMWPAYKPFIVKRFITLTEENQDAVNLVYASRNRIFSKSIDYNGSIIQDFESDVIETGYSGDKSKRSYSNINYWYDNYFIAYGMQKIKNKEDEDVKRKRKVYFINKIKYD